MAFRAWEAVAAAGVDTAEEEAEAAAAAGAAAAGERGSLFY